MTDLSFLDRPLIPFYLESGSGLCFSLFFPPEGGGGDVVLFVPPFGEEMNRTRPMVAMQARRLASRGIGCLMVDYRGTGDSTGEFREAEWGHWMADMIAATGWIRKQGSRLVALWGLRLGALMAAELCHAGEIDVGRLIFWQPVVDGRQMMTQFLRIRIAAQMDRGEKQESTAQIRDRLAAGELLEIAGYELNGRLSEAIESRKMHSLRPPGSVRVDWIESKPVGGEGLSRPSEKVVSAWRENGVEVVDQTFDGPPFWQLHEREMAPDIIDRTTGLFR
ncbi:MAG TPA: hydrolase 2, exosortase A system-associated [Sedimenticola thiotaurini]|uniref:Hydrolase 2, exosortase A system-associated n=1 Tax=Sedimenticola thiotaurini TaxID=1543721 RepID=A0A831W711_9GAMM|nr:hydrolase 2, exosortase A system-associated [Sedimenticola thiotaurini]